MAEYPFDQEYIGNLKSKRFESETLLPETRIETEMRPAYDLKQAIEREQRRKAEQTDSWTPENAPKSDIQNPGYKDQPESDKVEEFNRKMWERQRPPPLQKTDNAPEFRPLFPETIAMMSPLKPTIV